MQDLFTGTFRCSSTQQVGVSEALWHAWVIKSLTVPPALCRQINHWTLEVSTSFNAGYKVWLLLLLRSLCMLYHSLFPNTFAWSAYESSFICVV